MVAQITAAGAANELALREQSVEVDIGTDAQPASRLVFPPIPRLLENATVGGASVELNEGTATLLSAGLESELDRLLARRSEFKDSGTYLSKASRLALAVGRFEEARQLAESAVSINAASQSHRYRLAEAHLRCEHLDEAKRLFGELAAADHLPSCLRLVELAIRDSDTPSAASWVRRAETIDETDWRVQAVAGTVALAMGAFPQAVRHFRNSLEGRPRSVRLHYHIALAHVLTGHTRQAMKALRRAVGLDPFDQRSLVVWYDLSVHLKNDLSMVVRALEHYLQQHPHDSPTVNRLALALREQGETEAAYRLLRKARRSIVDAEIANNLGVVAAEAGKLPRALREFREACSLLVDHDSDEESSLRSVATSNLVRALIETGSFDLAIRAATDFANSVGLTRLLSEEPDYRVAVGLVEALQASSRLEEAAGLAEEWVERPEIHAGLDAALSEMLACYFSLQHIDSDRALAYAFRSYRLQSEIKPKDPVKQAAAINNLAFALLEVSRYEEAAKYLLRLQPIAGPDGAFAYATRGLMAFRMGNTDKGQELYERAIRMSRNEFKGQMRKKLYWELALDWRKKGDLKAARRHLGKVLKTRSRSIWKLDHLDTEAQRLLDEM